MSGKRNPNYTIPPLPPSLPTTVGEGGSMHMSIPTHTRVGFKGHYQPVLSLQDTPARVPTCVLGNMPPSERVTDTWNLLCLPGQFPCREGRKGGLVQGFINLTVDCNSNLSYIGIVSGNRLRRRGRRQWVTAILLLLPALLPSAEVQKNGAARAGSTPSSRLEEKGLVKFSVGKEKANLCHGAWPPQQKKHR